MSSPLSPEETKRRLGILIRRRRQSVSSDEEEEDGEKQWKEEELSINSKKPRVNVSNNDDASRPSMNEPPLDPLVRRHAPSLEEEETFIGSRILSDDDVKEMITSIQNTDSKYLDTYDARFKNHRSQFYESFVPIWVESRKKSSPLLDNLSYNHISSVISRSNLDNNRMYKSTLHYRYKEIYQKVGGIADKLYRENKKGSGEWKEVPTLENIHEIILEAHVSHGSTRTIASIKRVLNDRWYKVPERAVQIFLANCPCCLKKRKVLKSTRKNRLKMIVTTSKSTD
jgi:hypothetical protein